mmetsp:Transcript_79109/g.144292  ORF Transcript_79109/g.144292 Transcript_79109/m.144292 type:complete len:322 (+) Transcript_79109:334-1299(+)
MPLHLKKTLCHFFIMLSCPLASQCHLRFGLQRMSIEHCSERHHAFLCVVLRLLHLSTPCGNHLVVLASLGPAARHSLLLLLHFLRHVTLQEMTSRIRLLLLCTLLLLSHVPDMLKGGGGTVLPLTKLLLSLLQMHFEVLVKYLLLLMQLVQLLFPSLEHSCALGGHSFVVVPSTRAPFCNGRGGFLLRLTQVFFDLRLQVLHGLRLSLSKLAHVDMPPLRAGYLHQLGLATLLLLILVTLQYLLVLVEIRFPLLEHACALGGHSFVVVPSARAPFCNRCNGLLLCLTQIFLDFRLQVLHSLSLFLSQLAQIDMPPLGAGHL